MAAICDALPPKVGKERQQPCWVFYFIIILPCLLHTHTRARACMPVYIPSKHQPPPYRAWGSREGEGHKVDMAAPPCTQRAPGTSTFPSFTRLLFRGFTPVSPSPHILQTLTPRQHGGCWNSLHQRLGYCLFLTTKQSCFWQLLSSTKRFVLHSSVFQHLLIISHF